MTEEEVLPRLEQEGVQVYDREAGLVGQDGVKMTVEVGQEIDLYCSIVEEREAPSVTDGPPSAFMEESEDMVENAMEILKVHEDDLKDVIKVGELGWRSERDGCQSEGVQWQAKFDYTQRNVDAVVKQVAGTILILATELEVMKNILMIEVEE